MAAAGAATGRRRRRRPGLVDVLHLQLVAQGGDDDAVGRDRIRPAGVASRGNSKVDARAKRIVRQDIRGRPFLSGPGWNGPGVGGQGGRTRPRSGEPVGTIRYRRAVNRNCGGKEFCRPRTAGRQLSAAGGEQGRRDGRPPSRGSSSNSGPISVKTNSRQVVAGPSLGQQPVADLVQAVVPQLVGLPGNGPLVDAEQVGHLALAHAVAEPQAEDQQLASESDASVSRAAWQNASCQRPSAAAGSGRATSSSGSAWTPLAARSREMWAF